MKITKEGQPPEKPAYRQPPETWWEGDELTCPKCGCQFTVEEGDRPFLTAAVPGHAYWHCPTCGNLAQHIWLGYLRSTGTVSSQRP